MTDTSAMSPPLEKAAPKPMPTPTPKGHPQATVDVNIRVANPMGLGLAGFAGSTYIVASYMTKWWGGPESPAAFFPFVLMFGGLAQFIAGIVGFLARDLLVTIVNSTWGALWLAVGLLYLLSAASAETPHSLWIHFPELASWFVPLAFFTWVPTIAAAKTDLVLAGVLGTLSTGSTIAICLYAYGYGVEIGVKAAGYFFLMSSALAWLRVSILIIEDQYTILTDLGLSWLWRRNMPVPEEADSML